MTSRPAAPRTSRLFVDHRDFRFGRGRVSTRRQFGGPCADADRVFHLAAAVGVNLIVDSPLESLRTNIHGTEMVLEVARRAQRQSTAGFDQ